MSSIAFRSVVLAAYAAFFTLFFWPVLASGTYLTAGDGATLALPMYLGSHPLWEPNIMLGYPWSAGLNAQWYPLALLRLIPGSFNAYMVLAYVIAAFGTFGLALAVTGSRLGAVVAGIAYALGGFMIAHLGHYDVVHPGAWAPYVLWALVALRSEAGVRAIAGGSIALALCALSGQPQVLAYTLLVAAAYVISSAIPWRAQGRWLLDSALTIALGLGLAAVALVPGFELGRASVRVHLPFADFIAFSVPPLQITARLLFPFFLGTTEAPGYPFSRLDGGSFTELSDFTGVLTILLAVLALVARDRPRTVWFWLAVVGAGLLLSTGNGLGLAFVTYHLPLFNVFRAQGRNAFEVTLALAVLGAYGIAAIERRALSWRRVSAALVAVAVVVLATLAFAATIARAAYDPSQPLPPANPFVNPALGIPLEIFLAAALAIVVLVRWPTAVVARAGIVALAILDLSSTSWFAYWRYESVPPSALAPPPYVAALRASLDRSHERVLSLTPATTLTPNISTLWNLRSANGYVSLLLARMSEVLLMLPSGEVEPPVYESAKDAGIDLAAIRYVVFTPNFPDAAAFAAAHTRWRRVPATGTDLIYENLDPHPRAWVVHDVRETTYTDAHIALHDGSIKFGTTALVEGPDVPAQFMHGTERETVAVTADLPDEMSVDVNCATACFLVTSDADYHGWRASVDDAPARLYNTDFGLRGVSVPPGRHVVRFRYVPFALFAGLGLSIVSLAVLIVISVRPSLLRFRVPRLQGIITTRT